MDLKTLCELHGLSGNEGAVRKYLMEAARPLCDEVKIDRGGNLICLKKGTDPDAPAKVVAAHMDEVGFIVMGYTEDGLLRFRPIGGIDPRVVVSKWVEVGEDKVPGVIGAMAALEAIKVLTGAYRRDGGTITFAGGPAAFTSPSRPLKVLAASASAP